MLALIVWRDLPHPNLTFVSQEYAFRTADGSNNNVHNPELGKSGTPYGRSVQQVHPMPAYQLPDPSLIFDSLMKRDKVCYRYISASMKRMHELAFLVVC